MPDTFEELADSVFNMLPKRGRVDFVTDTYDPDSIKSFERKRRCSSTKFLISGPKTRTPKDWKTFLANSENKTSLIRLIFEQWKSDKYAEVLRDRNIYYVIGEKCDHLTCRNGVTVDAIPEEALFSCQEEADTRIILHCLHIRDNESEAVNIRVRSPDTDVLVLLVNYSSKIGRTGYVQTDNNSLRLTSCYYRC